MMTLFLESRVVRALAVGIVALAGAGCDADEESVTTEGTMRSDGYALFAVDNKRQQRNDVTVTVGDADPGATYVLLYSERAPRNVGWFRFDPGSRSRCGGSTGPHCEVPAFGHMVDVVTVPEGASEVVLRDERCGCDADNDDASWTGHWAVMRIERTDRTNTLRFDVRALKVRGYASEPKVDQLQ
ncbi:MAG: hypothetical protein KF850_26315 [Labilithrix sp.]|nr:hypothetical protein [Labilithrix sp.]